MKRLFASLILVTGVFAATSAFADTLSCQDIVGLWQGKLGNFHSVKLYIEDMGGNAMEDADISFTDPDGVNIEYGMLKGNCKENADGSVTMHLKQNAYGIQVNIASELTSKTSLFVSSFSFSDSWGDGHGSGSGTLSK